jgi:hypothetical protein
MEGCGCVRLALFAGLEHKHCLLFQSCEAFGNEAVGRTEREERSAARGGAHAGRGHLLGDVKDDVSDRQTSRSCVNPNALR